MFIGLKGASTGHGATMEDRRIKILLQRSFILLSCCVSFCCCCLSQFFKCLLMAGFSQKNPTNTCETIYETKNKHTHWKKHYYKPTSSQVPIKIKRTKSNAIRFKLNRFLLSARLKQPMCFCIYATGTKKNNNLYIFYYIKWNKTNKNQTNFL